MNAAEPSVVSLRFTKVSSWEIAFSVYININWDEDLKYKLFRVFMHPLSFYKMVWELPCLGNVKKNGVRQSGNALQDILKEPQPLFCQTCNFKFFQWCDGRCATWCAPLKLSCGCELTWHCKVPMCIPSLFLNFVALEVLHKRAVWVVPATIYFSKIVFHRLGRGS